MTNSIYKPGDTYVMTFRYGAMQLDAFTMEAGQTIQIETEWDFSLDDRAKDWSVVAYGTLGEVTIELEG
jgi:hypothetical protein